MESANSSPYSKHREVVIGQRNKTIIDAACVAPHDTYTLNDAVKITKTVGSSKLYTQERSK